MSVSKVAPFNWNGLSTELKEKVIGNCVSDIVSLYKVSRQVRAIAVAWTFRLVVLPKYDHPADLAYDFGRFEKFRQMALPSNILDHYHRRLYNLWPTIFPHLERFATFKHAIRHITLAFDFRNFLHFFKVTSKGFMSRAHHRRISVDDLAQLPKLTELVVVLPGKECNLYDKSRDYPRIFHHDDPCPRALHRAIYERIAADLVYIPTIKVSGFLDSAEEQRYNALRQKALADRADLYTPAFQHALYASDTAGGIALSREQAFVDTSKIPVEYPVWSAPECRCEVPCRRILKGLPLDGSRRPAAETENGEPGADTNGGNAVGAGAN